MKKADNDGVIRTKLGRKCRFDMWEPRDWGLWTSETFENAVAKYGKDNIKRAGTYKALNRLIQGSAADQTKLAVVECYKAGYLPKLQIHDELCFDIQSKEDEDKIQKIMEECMQLKVPSVVDKAIGDNWGETS
jgi:DNA polymerase I-like protein with 3'-5' exonuclease and polymerase domains